MRVLTDRDEIKRMLSGELLRRGLGIEPLVDRTSQLNQGFLHRWDFTCWSPDTHNTKELLRNLRLTLEIFQPPESNSAFMDSEILMPETTWRKSGCEICRDSLAAVEPW